jgi:hypothetical protein
VIFVDFSIFFSISTKKYWIFTNISIEILVPNLICLHFVLQNWLQNGQKEREIQFFFKKFWQISIYLDKISICLDLSRFVSKVSISLDDLDKNLDTSLSRLKSLDFKNLDRDKMKVDLDRRENLDNF